MKRLYLATLLILGFFFSHQEAKAQQTHRVLQFTGVVLGQDSAALPGAHIYVPKAGRGTTTNMYGFFSMPALPGDSLVISFVGYKKASYVIPEEAHETVKEVFTLQLDTTFLQEVDVYPLPPTAEAFKKEVLAMRLPSEYNNLDNALNPEVMAEMYKNMPMDGSMNHTWFVRQRAQSLQNQNAVPTNPLLNPFAWVELFKAIKNGDFKKGN